MALRIGEILIKKKVINLEQLDRALHEQARTGKFLGETLIAHGAITEKELLEVLGEQFNTRFVCLSEIQINPFISRMVPKNLVWEHKFMPIELRNSILLIAVSNPLDMWPLSAIQDKMDISEIQIVLATKADIYKNIEKHYGPEMGKKQA